MAFHSDILIFELLKLYTIITGANHLKYDSLEASFYEAITCLKKKEDCSKTPDFRKELTRLLENYSDYFEFDNGELYLTCDIDETFNMFLETHEFTETDFYLPRIIREISVYRSLNLPIPIRDVRSFFDANASLINAYKSIAEKSLANIPFKKELAEIKSRKEFLDNALEDENEEVFLKLKVCLDYLNFQLSSDSNEPFKDTSWNIILFESKQRIEQQLQYEHVDVLCAIMDQIDLERTDALINDYFEYNTPDDIEETGTTNLGEIPAFLTYFLIYLNRYLKSNPNCPVTKELTIKEYLLISVTELSHIEEYFLENATIDNLEFPELPQYRENSFEQLKPKVMACIASLNYTDNDITKNPNILSKIIICAIFIRCFLDLSINPESKRMVETLIKIRFYENPFYQITSDIINGIIFSDNLNQTRNS